MAAKFSISRETVRRRLRKAGKACLVDRSTGAGVDRSCPSKDLSRAEKLCAKIGG